SAVGSDQRAHQGDRYGVVHRARGVVRSLAVLLPLVPRFGPLRGVPHLEVGVRPRVARVYVAPSRTGATVCAPAGYDAERESVRASNDVLPYRDGRAAIERQADAAVPSLNDIVQSLHARAHHATASRSSWAA